MQWRKSERGWKFAFINGPGMSMLGRRQSAVFGPISSSEGLNKLADDFAATIGVSLTHSVSDSAGEIFQFIHRNPPRASGSTRS